MEYVVVRALHPTYLSLQLPTEVAELLRHKPRGVRDVGLPGRGITFLARGPGVVRVVDSFSAREILAVETLKNRYLSQARVSRRLLFSLPATVVRHLGLQTQPRGLFGARATDDGILWFLPAPEYYEFRARERSPKGWTGPSPGGFAHVYIARSLIPMPSRLDDLTAFETRVESEEWRPRIEALEGRPRARRAG
jgi:hypothetical protein